MLRRLLQPLIAITVIVALTEWVHFRLGQPTLLSAFIGQDIEVPHRLDPGFGPVAESEFQRYVRVLHSMHANRGLSIEEAARRERFSLEEFRELELRIQRDNGLVERVRTALRERAEELWQDRREDLSASAPSSTGETAPEG